MADLPSPRAYEAKILRSWLNRSSGGDQFLDRLEAQPYHEENEHDLVALAPTEYDRVTGWLAEKIMPWLVRKGLSKAVCRERMLVPRM